LARIEAIGARASPPLPSAVYRKMGYIFALVLLLIAVPLIFIMASRRTTSAGGMAAKPRDRGVTVSKPSSDQPKATPATERRLPPG
jgi:hypothetical protein